MNRKLIFLFAWTVGIFSTALAQNILPVPAVADYDTLRKAIQFAETTDISIIELTTSGGLYTNDSSTVIKIYKPMTIRAAAGLEKKPIIMNRNPGASTRIIFEIMDGGSLTLQGLELDGLAGTDTPAKYLIRTDDDPQAGATGISVDKPYWLKIIDCYLHDVVRGSDGNFFRAYKYTFADSVILRNSIFVNSGKEGIRLKGYYDVEGYGFYQTIYFEATNCTFLNTNKEAIVLYAGDNNPQTPCPTIVINHCTFNNCGYNNSRVINAWDCDGAIVKNCNITNSPTNEWSVKLYGSTSMICYSNLYNVGELRLVRDAKEGIGNMNVNPLYTDLWNGDFTLTLDSPLLDKADDGTAIGDPRWDPTLSAVDDQSVNQIPLKFELNQNYPNPFNPTTTISFALKNPGRASIKIYNLTGQLVKILLDENLNGGSYQIVFDASDLASDVYFYELQSGRQAARKKMILVR